MRKSRTTTEFGDFQTPDILAEQVVRRLSLIGIRPKTVIEPSCGKGAFLLAAAKHFPEARIFGFDVNSDHIAVAVERLCDLRKHVIQHVNFFACDWARQLSQVDQPILILGNPPWVTNSELGTLGSDNLPTKSNFQNMKGLDAITGKSNFDISEWMILENLKWVQNLGGTIAVLCKTAVARKILKHVWKANMPVSDARIYRIDASKHFSAAVDACLFVLIFTPETHVQVCHVYSAIECEQPSSNIGFVDGFVVSDLDAYDLHSDLIGPDKSYTWRSGVKHDCSKVMEFDVTPDGLTNGFGEVVDIEGDYLYPLKKSSDIGGSNRRKYPKMVLLTQRAIGEPTASIAQCAPRTWSYLQKHQNMLDGRTSAIYRNKPKFSMFGIGDYSFTPWKVAISGLYKNLNFKVIGCTDGKPIMVDDTAYFLPFESETEAFAVCEMLMSGKAQQLLSAMVFWDEKRPVTVELLKRLNVKKLASSLGRESELVVDRNIDRPRVEERQLRMFA